MQGKNIQKTLFLLLLISVLVGCSSVKLGYRFMDNAIRWKMNEYVSLNSLQSSEVKRGINEFHLWHQKTQLSLYADYMGRLAILFEKETLSPNEVSKIYDKVFDHASVSLDKLMPVITDMLLSLSPEQVKFTIKKLERNSKKDLKEDFAITPVQRLAKRRNKMIKRVSKWTGRLNQEQIKIISEWSKALPVDEGIRVTRQEKFVAALSKQLNDRSNPEQFKKTVLTHIKTPERFSSPEYKKSYAKRKQMTVTLMSDLFNSLTASQKMQLIRSTRKYQSDFLYLAPKQ